MYNVFRALFQTDEIGIFTPFSFRHLRNKLRTEPSIVLTIICSGTLLTASSGSWDITNHLLNRPETFFSPPHAGLYSGVVLTLFGSLMIYQYHRNNRKKKSEFKNEKSTPIHVKLIVIGVIMLVSAGPLDFAWHSSFGLDGLLSPPHAVLTIGMALCSIGALAGLISIRNYRIRRFELNNNIHNDTNTYDKRYSIYIIIATTAVWITVSGIIHMLSLPFSDTEYFKFNPDPILASLIATLCFPFLISFVLFSSWKVTKRFGVLSIIGMIFIAINLVTTMLPNESLVPTIPFYLLNIIPIVSIDVLLSTTTRKTSQSLIYSQRGIIYILSGIILGLAFFTLYYPLITHTYNEVSANRQPVWPSVTAPIYFGMIDEVYILMVVSAITTGMLGVIISSKVIVLQDRSVIRSTSRSPRSTDS